VAISKILIGDETEIASPDRPVGIAKTEWGIPENMIEPKKKK